MKTKLLSLIIAFMFVSMNLMAVDIIVGTGTSANNSYPFGAYYKYSTTEFVYTAQEIGGRGTINGISFYVNGSASISATVKIYLGHTSSSSLSSQITSGMTCVYSASRTIGSSTGWEYLSLSTPFNYNGIDNLVVIVTKSCSSYNSSLTYRYSTGPTGLYRQSDSTTGYATWDYSGGFSTTTDRPNIKFNISNYINADPLFLERVNNLSSDYDFSIDNIYYKIESRNDLTCKVVRGNGYTQTSLEIPPVVNYNGKEISVIGIDDYAIALYDIETITIPNTVLNIGKGALGGCNNLRSLTLPSELSSVPDSLAYLCRSLSNINLSESIKSIGRAAFYGCSSLSSAMIPASTEEIKYEAFKGCGSLSSITIPESVSSIESSAFYNCSNLVSVTISSNRVVSKSYTLDFSLRNIFGTQVKDYIIGDQVTCIGDYAFSYCTSLSSSIIPNSVTSINNNAFYGCSNLTSITIPNSVTVIHDNVFDGCSKLSAVSFEDSNASIKLGKKGENGAFGGLPISNLYIGRDLLYDSEYPPFKNNTVLKKLVVGNNVTEFPDNSLSKMTSLTEISIGDGLTTIPSFNTCTKLKKITLGAGLISISSFKACEVIDTIYLHSPIPQSVEEEFTNKIYVNCILKVPTGSLEAYQNAEVWKDFWNVSEYDYEVVQQARLRIISPKDILRQNASMTLSAKLYPENIICNDVIWTSKDTNIATVAQDGTITGINIGSTTIIARSQENNLSDSCTIRVTAPYEIGDVNDDGYINIADISGIINFIMEINTENLVFMAADINKDNQVLIDDLTDLISMIMHPNLGVANVAQRRFKSPQMANLSDAYITAMANEGDMIDVILSEEFSQYSGLQFDIILPTGYRIEDIISNVTDDVQSVWSSLSDNEFRIMLFSPSNTAFHGDVEKTISLKYAVTGYETLRSVTLHNIVATTPLSHAVYLIDYNFEFGNTTSVQSSDVVNGGKSPIYNLAGQRVAKPRTGLYVKDGKIFICK